MFDELAGYLVGQLRIEFKPHLGEFDADVGVETALLNGVEQSMIDVGRVPCLVGGRDVFAEAVKGCGDALGIHAFGGAEDILDLHAGDEAG